ncbi:MAG: hypothetical protein JXR87_08045 [Candidatus Marinimicrobia bacterium]|nr:hypothetical protein [Candidatus Neomarinimicrobiota bacterium]
MEKFNYFENNQYEKAVSAAIQTKIQILLMNTVGMSTTGLIIPAPDSLIFSSVRVMTDRYEGI